mmetsp:Transcript_3579/g.5265  ORF Transcript_3579/g.5265 Transcript_3579/m.5265 type:complete len:548 (-) Transcript_3579:16-1659(-)
MTIHNIDHSQAHHHQENHVSNQLESKNNHTENEELKTLLKQQSKQLQRVNKILETILKNQHEQGLVIQSLIESQQSNQLETKKWKETNYKINNIQKELKFVVSQFSHIKTIPSPQTIPTNDKKEEEPINLNNRKRKHDSINSRPLEKKKELPFKTKNENLSTIIERFYKKQLLNVATTLNPVGVKKNDFLNGYIKILYDQVLYQHSYPDIAKACMNLYAKGYHKQPHAFIIHQFITQLYKKLNKDQFLEELFINLVTNFEKYPRKLASHHRLEGLAVLSKRLPSFKTCSFCLRSALLYWMIHNIIESKDFAFEKMLRMLSSNQTLIDTMPLFRDAFSYVFYRYTLKSISKRNDKYKDYVEQSMKHVLKVKRNDISILSDTLYTFCNRILISISDQDEFHYIDPTIDFGKKLILLYIQSLPIITWDTIYNDVIVKLMFTKMGTSSLAIQFICHMIPELIHRYYDGVADLSHLIQRLKQVVVAGDIFHFKTRCICLSSLIEIGMPLDPFAKDWVQSKAFETRYQQDKRVIQWLHPSLRIKISDYLEREK